MPADAAVLESNQERKDLPCVVTPRKPELGFDLRFHTGYDVSVPFRELAGDGEVITVIFQVYPQNRPAARAYFVQHFRVPVIEDDAKGDAFLDGGVDVGESSYHIDWMMRDRSERVCSTSWDVDAALPPKDKPMPLFIKDGEIAESVPPFANDSVRQNHAPGNDAVTVKLLVNFAPQHPESAALQRTDTDALVSILKSIERDPHVDRISLVAFNMEQERIVYRQEAAATIDFPALGKALASVKLGTVDVAKLGQKHSETDFLQALITSELTPSMHPDAVIFAGPKAMLDADVPADDLRRIGDIECPVFYMNYNLNPQAVPWKDSISHAIKAFKGTEYTISRPRDLWISTTEMLNRIVRSKHQRELSSVSSLGTASSAGAGNSR